MAIDVDALNQQREIAAAKLTQLSQQVLDDLTPTERDAVREQLNAVADPGFQVNEEQDRNNPRLLAERLAGYMDATHRELRLEVRNGAGVLSQEDAQFFEVGAYNETALVAKMKGIALTELPGDAGVPARSDPGELDLSEQQKADMRADLDKGRAPADVTPAEQAHINEVAAATYAQTSPRDHGLAVQSLNGLSYEDAIRLEQAARAMEAINGHNYFTEKGFDSAQLKADMVAYQEQNGLPANGELTPRTLTQMQSDLQMSYELKGNEAAKSGLRALGDLKGEFAVSGYTPPDTTNLYPTKEETDRILAGVREETAQEVSAIRAEQARTHDQHTQVVPNAHDIIAEEKAKFDAARANGEIPSSLHDVLATEQHTFRDGQSSGAIPMTTAGVLLQEQMAQDTAGIAAARQQLTQGGYDPTARIEEIAARQRGDEYRQPASPAAPPPSGASLWADDAPAAPSQASAGTPQTTSQTQAAQNAMTIEEGDTLSKIAAQNLRDHGKSVTTAAVEDEVDRLAKLNNIENENKIYAGASLKLDGSPATATAQATTSPAAPSPSQIAADEPPKTPEELRDERRAANINRISSFASQFGLPGSLIGAVAELLPPIERNMPSTQQGVQVADGSSVVPMQTPGKGPAREASMAV